MKANILLAVALASCSSALPNTQVVNGKSCTHMAQKLVESQLYNNTVTVSTPSGGTLTLVEVRNDLQTSPILAWTGQHKHFIYPNHSKTWNASGQSVEVRQTFESYVPGHVEVKATYCN